jgi:segregation and condensation protein B
MAPSRKQRRQSDKAPTAAEVEPSPPTEASITSEDAAPGTPETPAGSGEPEGTVVEATASAVGDEAASLETAGEMEEEPAVLIDGELAALLKTPPGLRGAIEALLLASPEPLTVRRIGNVLDLRDGRLVLATLKQLQAEYDGQRRGIQILETAEGFQMATRELFGDLLLRLKSRRRRPALSAAALETLAIIAYRQPIIRAEVEAIRGVESSGSIRNLIDMGLVEMVGRKDVLGRPPMYGTTAKFLPSFGLKSLAELPSIGELKRRIIESEKAAEAAEQQALADEHEEQMRRRLATAEFQNRHPATTDAPGSENAGAGASHVQPPDASSDAGDEKATFNDEDDDLGDEDALDDDEDDEDDEEDADDHC